MFKKLMSKLGYVSANKYSELLKDRDAYAEYSKSLEEYIETNYSDKTIMVFGNNVYMRDIVIPKDKTIIVSKNANNVTIRSIYIGE